MMDHCSHRVWSRNSHPTDFVGIQKVSSSLLRARAFEGYSLLKSII